MKTLLYLLVLGIGCTGLFYWYALRPAQIKHDCSWIKGIKPATQAYPAKTEDELRNEGLVKMCPSPASTPLPMQNGVVESFFRNLNRDCQESNRRIVEEYRNPRQATPEKVTWRKASNEEYKFCLRDKGL